MLQDVREEQDWSRNVSNTVRVLNISKKVRDVHERVPGNWSNFSQAPIENALYNISETINRRQVSSRSTVDLDVAKFEGLAASNSGQRSQKVRSPEGYLLLAVRDFRGFYFQVRKVVRNS